MKKRTHRREEWDVFRNDEYFSLTRVETNYENGLTVKKFCSRQTNTMTGDSLYRLVELKQEDLDGNILNHKYLSYLPNSNYLDEINDVYLESKKIDRITKHEVTEVDEKGNVTLRTGYRNGKVATITVCTLKYK